MNPDLIIVSILILFMVTALYLEWFKPVIVFLLTIVAFVVSGILKPGDALHGFANEQIAVVFLLLIISGIIRKTGMLNTILNGFLSTRLSHRSFILRMSIMIGTFSGFLNNTPLVAIMLPNVYEWAKRKQIAPSKVLLPLSYAAIVGGMITLIGSSTNLVVNGLAADAGLQPLGFFEFSKIGLIVLALMCIYLLLFSPLLLRDRKGALTEFEEHTREFMVKTRIPNHSGFINKTIDEAGLRNLRGLFLVEIIRAKKIITPVVPNEILIAGDELVFAGDTSTIVDLLLNHKNMELAEAQIDFTTENSMVEAVISTNSSLTDRTVKQSNFRENFNASIVAINRDGERLRGRIGDIHLKAGDLLLLVAGTAFFEKANSDSDLHLISQQNNIAPMDRKSSLLLVAGFALSIVVAATGLVNLFTSLLILIALVIIFKIVRIQDFKKFMDFELIAILALAIGVGHAIYISGTADVFASAVIRLVEPLHSELAILFSIYIIANVLTMFVTNAASAAISFPVAIACFQFSGSEQVAPYLLTVAFASSADFITPFGYQTNLMVFGPGGYKFSDYLRFGIIPTIATMLVCVFAISYFYGIK